MLKIFRPKKIIIIFLFFLLSSNYSFAQRDTHLYHKGVGAAKSGNNDFAFIYFRRFLQGNSDSRLAKDAVFAIAEYYYSLKSYPDSSLYFKKFVTGYPKNDATIFAYAYLLKLAKADEKQKLTEALEKKIVTYHNLSLLFSEFKEFKYKSPFAKAYKALYYIDRVEIYIDETIFAEIPY